MQIDRSLLKFTLGAVIAGVTVVSVHTGARADAIDDAIKARLSFYQVAKHYFGGLAAMAKGDVKYDAEKAALYARTIETLSLINTDAMWPEASSNEDRKGKTRALSKIWSTYPAVNEKQKAWVDSAAVLAKSAGAGLNALRADLTKVNDSCNGCHETYRAKDF